jgi:four helix bundle protein
MTEKKKQNIGDFRSLSVYKKALIFRRDIYGIVEKFPSFEKDNMCDQLRRASSSIGANIVEGNSNYYYGKEFDRLNTALGSVAECRAFLDMSVQERYTSNEKYRELDEKAEEIMKMLIGLLQRLERILGNKVFS